VFSGSASGLDASNEFNFLISEIGTVGLIVFIVLSVRVIARAVRVVRSKRDQESRGYAAALASGLVAVAVAWLYTLPSAATPLAPFFWTAAGIVAWASTNAAVEPRVSAADQRLEAPGSVAPLAE
jgi:O-antigen ligase